MIELLRSQECTECDAVVDVLRQLEVEFTVTVVHGDQDEVPLLRDGDRVVARDEIKTYLAELGHDISEWDRFAADTMYSDGNSTPE